MNQAILAAVVCLSMQAAEGPVAYRGARIITATGQIFEPGVIVVANGKILDVGAVDGVVIPPGAAVKEVTGKTIIPGLVDSHSHLGVFSRPGNQGDADGNEMTGPVQSIVRAMDAINPADPGIKMALAGGVTTANIMPGSGNVIGGQTLYVKLRGPTVEQMRVQSATVLGGLKMANGENPKRAYGGKGQAPMTRMKTFALQRSEFVKAREYQRKWGEFRAKLAAGEKPVPPVVDLGLEPLVEVLERKRTVHFHSHRADDIVSTLRLMDEFHFELVLQHGTESYKVADEIARRKVPVSMTVVDGPGGKAEVVDLMEECGAKLAKAGVTVIVNTDDPITESRFLLRTAATTVRGGLPEETALRAVTIHPARAMHLDDRIGTLERGKDADFVVLSGPPFSVYSRVLQTYIEGQLRFNYDKPFDRAYQTGGFAQVDRSTLPEPKANARPQEPTTLPPEMPGSAAPNSSSSEFAILAGRVHTVGQGSIDNGAVLVREGKIVFVGPRANLNLQPGMAVLRAAHVTPGLIDALSIVPLSGGLNIPADQDADEVTDPNQADLRVADAFNPREPQLRFLLEQGITVIHACPGPTNVIAGQTGVFRTHGKTMDGMTVRFPQAVAFNLGVKPKTAYPGKRPGTRMGTAALIRSAFTEAVSARRRGVQADAKSGAAEPNPKLDALSLLLDRKIPALISAHRADDIHTALRLADEFKIRLTVGMATEGYMLADRLAESKTPVFVHPTMQVVADPEKMNGTLTNAAALADRGVSIAIASGAESYVPKSRVVRLEAAIAAVNGLGFDRALRAITLDAAKLLEIEDRFGSLEIGKVADLVLYDGDPFEYATHVSHVVQGGKLVFDRRRDKGESFERLVYFVSPEAPCCLFGAAR